MVNLSKHTPMMELLMMTRKMIMCLDLAYPRLIAQIEVISYFLRI